VAYVKRDKLSLKRASKVDAEASNVNYLLENKVCFLPRFGALTKKNGARGDLMVSP